MNINTEDRRVRKTKKALREGLAKLMVEKDLKNITVRELTDEVDIHRGTFYAHYSDIFALYEQIELSAFEDLSEIVNDDAVVTYDDFFDAIVAYIHENTLICRMLFGKKGSRSFLEQLSNFWVEKCIEIWMGETKQVESPEEWRFLAYYRVQGVFSMISHWVEDSCSYPQDKLKHLITEVDSSVDTLFLKKMKDDSL